MHVPWSMRRLLCIIIAGRLLRLTWLQVWLAAEALAAEALDTNAACRSFSSTPWVVVRV